jgi:quercetin dioxygenase-like cupin family protein
MTTGRPVRSAIALLALCIFPVLPGSVSLAGAQSGTAPTLATDITAAEIEAVAKTAEGTDREIKIVDLGKYNFGVAVLRRSAMKPGGPASAINHTQLTEVYYIVSGAGTLVTGGDVTNVKALPATNELVTTVVGPTNTATFSKPAQTRKVAAGDVVIIPAGVYHGWAEVPDHIEYVSMRPDVEKVLPAGYVNPTLKK